MYAQLACVGFFFVGLYTLWSKQAPKALTSVIRIDDDLILALLGTERSLQPKASPVSAR